MKKAFALVGAIALTLTPSTLTAENLIAKESHTKQRMHFLNDDLSDEILNALERKGNTLQPGANFKVAKLRDIGAEGTDLTNEDLRYAPLSGSNLRGANLSGVDLNGRDLSGSDLTNAILKGTKLKEANLTGANLTGADLTRAELNKANLTDAVLTSANLNNATLSGAELTGANLTSAKLNKANLSGAELTGAKLISAKLNNANLTNTRINDKPGGGSNWEDADLIGADLSGASLWNVLLQTVDFTNANLTGAEIISNDMRGTRFTKANLTDTGLSGLSQRMRSNNFDGAKFKNKEQRSSILCRFGFSNKSFHNHRRRCHKYGYDEYMEMRKNGILEIEEDVVVVQEDETAEAEDINFDSITVESLPYSVDCPPKNKDLEIKQNKKEMFVVRFDKGKKFYNGEDFEEAVNVFEEYYEEKCVE